MTGSAHFRRILVGRWCLALVDRQDAMRAVATAATRRIIQSRQQKGLAVLTRQITIDQCSRFVMAGTAGLDLVYRRYGGREVCNFVNGMGSAVTVIAARLAFMDAAPCSAHHAAVAFAATALVGQRLEVGTFVFSRDIRMALLASNVRVRSRCEGHALMALTAVDLSGVCRIYYQNTQRQCRNRQAGETKGRSHFWGSLKAALLVSQREIRLLSGFSARALSLSSYWTVHANNGATSIYIL